MWNRDLPPASQRFDSWLHGPQFPGFTVHLGQALGQNIVIIIIIIIMIIIVMMMMMIVINLIYIAQFNANGILTALYIVIKYI